MFKGYLAPIFMYKKAAPTQTVLPVGTESTKSHSANLVTPIELVGYPVSSSATESKIFTKTYTEFDTSKYDGTQVTYEFEALVYNANASNAYSVTLYDVYKPEAVASVSVPANTTVTTRLRSTSFTPWSGVRTYAISLPQTGSANDIRVYSARIIVTQTSASRTRIQVPLLNAGTSYSNLDTLGIDSTTSESYVQSDAGAYSLWSLDTALWGTISNVEFHAVIKCSAGTAYACLYNATGASAVASSVVSTNDTSFAAVKVGFSPFSSGFTDDSQFEARIKSNSTSNTASIAFACLYLDISLVNKGEIYYRVGGSRAAGTTGVNIVTNRVKIDSSSISTPSLYHEATFWEETSGEAILSLYDDNTNDSGTTGSSVTNSVLTAPTSRGRVRGASPITALTSGDRVYGRRDASTNNVTIASMWLVAAWVGDSVAYLGSPKANFRTHVDGIATSEAIGSVTASALGTGTLSFEVFLEMLDYGASNPSSSVTTFNRSKLSLDPADYDGATYYFEVVAYNETGSSQTITLYNTTTSSSAVTLSAPNGGGSGNSARTRSSAFTPATGENVYALRLPSIASADTVRVFTARIVIVQVNGSKTRLQFPLSASVYSNYSNTDDGSAYVDSRVSSTYGFTDSAYHAIWKKVSANLATVSEWTYEALLSLESGTGPGYSALCQKGTTTVVTGSELTCNTTTPTLYSADFSDSATNFSDNTEFEGRLKGDGSFGCRMHRSALYVRLTSLSKLESYMRWSVERGEGTTAAAHGRQRMQLNSDNFSGDTVTYLSEATGYCADNADCYNPYNTTSDSLADGSATTGAGVNFNSASRVRVRSSSGFTAPTSGSRLYAQRLASTNVSCMISGFVVVQVQGASLQTVNGTTENLGIATTEAVGTLTLNVTVPVVGIAAPSENKSQTFYSSTADGYIDSWEDNSYASALSGSHKTAQVAATTLIVGQLLTGVTYGVDEGFISFDTSVVGQGSVVTSSVLQLWLNIDRSDTDFTFEARLYDWTTGGLTVVDWQTSIGGLTRVASRSTTPTWGTSGYVELSSESQFPSGINTSGITALLLVSDRTVSQTQPTTYEYLQVYTADYSSGSRAPKLYVEWTSYQLLGSPKLNHIQPVTGIASAEALGAPLISRSIPVSGIATAEALGSSKANLRIHADGIATAEALGNVTRTWQQFVTAGIGNYPAPIGTPREVRVGQEVNHYSCIGIPPWDWNVEPLVVVALNDAWSSVTTGSVGGSALADWGVGPILSGENGESWNVQEIFSEIDASFLPDDVTVISTGLYLVPDANSGFSMDEAILQLRAYDWGESVTTGTYLSASELSALPLLVEMSYGSQPLHSGTSVLNQAVQTGGVTKLVWYDKLVLGSEPEGYYNTNDSFYCEIGVSWHDIQLRLLTVYVPSQTVDLTDEGIASAEALGTPYLINDQFVILTGEGLSSLEAFGSPQVDRTVPVTGIPTGETQGSPKANQTVPITCIYPEETVGTPTAVPGVVTRVCGDIPTAEAVGSVTITTTYAVVGAGGIATEEAIGTIATSFTMHMVGIEGPQYASMITGTFYTPGSDGRLLGRSTDYSSAREVLFGQNTSEATSSIGQQYQSPNYFCYEFFVKFDTSSIGNGSLVSTATLGLWKYADLSVTDFILEARIKDWGALVSSEDWVAGSSLSGYQLVATKDTSEGFTTGGYTDFTSEASFSNSIARAGTTYLMVSSSRQRTGSVPTGEEYVSFYTGDDASARYPRIVVDWYPQGNGLGSSKLKQTQTVAGIASTEALGAPTTRFTIHVDGIPTAEAVGTPTLIPDQLILPLSIESAEAIGSVTAVPGALTIVVTAIDSAEALGSPKVNVTFEVDGIPDASGVGAVTITTSIKRQVTGIPLAATARLVFEMMGGKGWPVKLIDVNKNGEHTTYTSPSDGDVLFSEQYTYSDTYSSADISAAGFDYVYGALNMIIGQYLMYGEYDIMQIGMVFELPVEVVGNPVSSFSFRFAVQSLSYIGTNFNVLFKHVDGWPSEGYPTSSDWIPSSGFSSYDTVSTIATSAMTAYSWHESSPSYVVARPTTSNLSIVAVSDRQGTAPTANEYFTIWKGNASEGRVTNPWGVIVWSEGQQVDLSGDGLASGEVIGSVTVFVQQVVQNAGGIESQEALGSITLTTSYGVANAGGIESLEALGSVTSTYTVHVGGVAAPLEYYSQSFYSGVADGHIASTSATYETARSGGGTLAVVSTTSTVFWGQDHTGYKCYEGFLGFDTSGIGADASISSATLSLYGATDWSVTDFTSEARIYDWGGTLSESDWVAGGSLSALTLVASLATSDGWLVDGYNQFTSTSSMLSEISKTGMTYLVLSSSGLRSGDIPTQREYVSCYSANYEEDMPKLYVEWRVGEQFGTPKVGEQTVNGTTEILGIPTASAVGTVYLVWDQTKRPSSVPYKYGFGVSRPPLTDIYKDGVHTLTTYPYYQYHTTYGAQYYSGSGEIESRNADYSTARSATSGYVLGFDQNFGRMGQKLYNGSLYQLWQTHLSFDTESIPSSATVNSCSMAYTFFDAKVTTPFVLQFRSANVPEEVSLDDWLTGAEFATLDVVASMEITTDYLNLPYWEPQSISLDISAVVPGGATGIVLCSDRFASGSAPTEDEWVEFYMHEEACYEFTEDGALTLIVEWTLNQAIDLTDEGIPTAEAFGTVTVEQNEIQGQTVDLTDEGIGSEEAFGAPTLHLHYTAATSGIETAEAVSGASGHYRIHISGIDTSVELGSPGTEFVLTLGGIGTGEALGSSSQHFRLHMGSISTAEAVGTLYVYYEQFPVILGIDTTEAFGSVTITTLYGITNAGGIASEEAFGSATVALGGVSRTVAGIASGEAFGSITWTSHLTQSVTAIASEEAFGAPAVHRSVPLDGIGSGELLGSSQANFKIYSSSISSTEELGSTVLLATYRATISGIVTEEAPGTIVYALGEVTVGAVGIPGAEQFGSPTFSSGLDLYGIGGLASGEALGSVTIALGGVSRTVIGIASEEAIGSLSTAFGVPVSGIASGEVLGSVSWSGVYRATLAGIDSAESLGSITWTGHYTATISGVSSGEAFGEPTYKAYYWVTILGIDTGEAQGVISYHLGAVTAELVGIGSLESIGSPTFTLELDLYNVGGIGSEESLGNISVALGGVARTAGDITSQEAFGSLVIYLRFTCAVTGIASEEAFGAGTLYLMVFCTTTGIASEEGLGTVACHFTIGIVALPSGEAFGSASWTTTYTASVSGIETGEAQGSISYALGVVTVTIIGIGSGEALGSLTLSTGYGVTGAGGIASEEAIGAPTAVPGGVTAVCSGLITREAMGEVTVHLHYHAAVSGIDTEEAMGEVTVHRSLRAEGIGSGEVVSDATWHSHLTLQVVDIPPPDAYGDVTIHTYYWVSVSGLESGEAQGSITYALGEVTVDVVGIPGAEAFGSVTFSLIGFVSNAGGIASSESFGTPLIHISIPVLGIATGEALGVPVTVYVQHADGIAGAELFGEPFFIFTQHLSGIASGEAVSDAGWTTHLDVGLSSLDSSEALGTVGLHLHYTVALGGIGGEEGEGEITIGLYTTVGVVGIPSAQAMGLVLFGLYGLPDGIPSGESFGELLLHRSVPASGVGSGEAFGDPVLHEHLSVAVAGIASEEAVGSSVALPGELRVPVAGIATEEAFGSPTITLGGVFVANAGGIASGEAFGAVTVVPGAVTSICGDIASSEGIGTVLTRYRLRMTSVTTQESVESVSIRTWVGVGIESITSEEAPGQPTQRFIVHLSGIAGEEALSAPTYLLGGVSRTTEGVATGEALGEPSTRFTQHALSIPGGEVFGSPSFLFGGVSRAAAGIASGEAFGSVGIHGHYTQGVEGIGAAEEMGSVLIGRSFILVGIASEEAFGTVLVIPGPVTVLVTGIASAEVVSSVAVSTVGSFSVIGIPTGEALGSLTVIPGPVSRAPSALDSGESIGSVVMRLTTHVGSIDTVEEVGTGKVNYRIRVDTINSEEEVQLPNIVTFLEFAVVGITSAQVVGTITLRLNYDVTIVAIAGVGVFGQPTISWDQFISLVGLASGEAIGTLGVSEGGVLVVAVSIASEEQLGVCTAVPGSVTAAPAGIGTGETTGVPVVIVDQVIDLVNGGVATGEGLGDVYLIYDQSLSLSGIASAEALGILISEGVAHVPVEGVEGAELFGSVQVVSRTVTVGIASAEYIGVVTVLLAGVVSVVGIESREKIGRINRPKHGRKSILANQPSDQVILGNRPNDDEIPGNRSGNDTLSGII